MDLSDDDYYEDEDYCDGNNEYEDEDQNPPTEDASESCTVKGSSCKVITKGCLLSAQIEDLQRVMEMLSLKEHHARTLLIHYQWNVDKVFDVFINKGKDILYAEACLIVPDDANNISSPTHSSKAFCEICKLEDGQLAHQMTTMDCNHCFCNNCWTEYFITMINDGESKQIKCIVDDCNTICSEVKIRILLNEKNPQLASKFDSFLLESYIEDNKRVKWCPSDPHCGNAIRIDDGDEYREVECACGFQFCFNCSSEPHSPCSCQMLELWKEKCNETSLDISWITRYYNLFDAHRDSYKEEINLKEWLQSNIVKKEAPTDANWVIDVADRFFMSRRILSYSYPFAYYMFVEDLLSNQMTAKDKKMKKDLFENHQLQLRAYLEELSFFLHQPYDLYLEEEFKKSKIQMLTLSSIIDDLCKRLFEFIETELLVQHQLGTKIHIIAPYRPNGPEKAVKFDH